VDVAILPEFLGLPVLGSPVLDLFAPCIIDAADFTEGVEDEVRPFVSFDVRGDELHILNPEPVEDLDEALVGHRDAKGGPAEVERISWHIEREARHTAKIKGMAVEKLPRAKFLTLLIQGSSQVPARMRASVIPQVVVLGHVWLWHHC
jgi:hypothetical protein